MRSFYGYVQTKQKYQLTLAQSLYFLNLDNNAGVLFRLLDEAEEQECREALLAWHFLWRNPRPDGWSETELDEQVEAYLRRSAGVDVDFEVTDALAQPSHRSVILPISETDFRGLARASAVCLPWERVVQTYPLDRPASNLLLLGGHVPPQSSPQEERQAAPLLERGRVAPVGGRSVGAAAGALSGRDQRQPGGGVAQEHRSLR